MHFTKNITLTGTSFKYKLKTSKKMSNLSKTLKAWYLLVLKIKKYAHR